jgi:hypothetical protein
MDNPSIVWPTIHIRRYEMQKAKEMCQRRVRFPDDVKLAIERNGEKECRKFNTEIIYQLRKVYGLTGEKNSVA